METSSRIRSVARALAILDTFFRRGVFFADSQNETGKLVR